MIIGSGIEDWDDLNIAGLFDYFETRQDSNNQFVTEQTFKTNLTRQLQMTPQTMEQLRKIDVSAGKELKLEYFFYTTTSDKAKGLAGELEKLDYEVTFGKSAGEKNSHPLLALI